MLSYKFLLMLLFISIKGFFLFMYLIEFEEKGIKLIDVGSLFLILFELISSYLEMKFFENVIWLILLLLFLKLRLFLNFVMREFGIGEGLFGFFECFLCGGI